MQVKMKTVLHAFAAVIIFFLTDSSCHALIRMAVSLCSSSIFLTALYVCLNILNVWTAVFLYAKYMLKASVQEIYLGKPFPALRQCAAALVVPLAADAVCFIFTKGTWKIGCDTKQGVASIVFYEVFHAGFQTALTEGMIFRGMLFRVLQKGFGNKAGIFLSSFLYATASFIFYHGFAWKQANAPETFLLTFFMGLAFTLLVFQTGSIWFSVVIHFFYNVFSGNSYILHMDTRQDFPAVIAYTVRSGGIVFANVSVSSLAVYLVLVMIIWIHIKKEKQDISI